MDVFRLFGRIALDNDEANRGIDETTKKAEGAHPKIGAAFSKIGSAAVAAGKVIVKGLAVGSAAVGALVGTAIKSYAEYEQLVGGAQLMFGEAYDTVALNAKNAYATVQLSQSEYLEQVNGFAVGLKTALGGNEQAAADLSHRIIQAEADVVAATGESQEAIQNAFNGIMKNNFSMVDNLKLGITATKEGFQEVIDKANEWNEEQGRSTQYTIDNVADCQSALIDYIEMQGLSGYAANEASKTIMGSMSKAKAAWKNLVVAMASDGFDLREEMDALIESVGDVAENLIPRIQIALHGVVELIEELAPLAIGLIQDLFVDLLPTIADSAVLIVQTLVDGLSNNSETLMSTILEIGGIIGSAITEMLPQIIQLGMNLVVSLASGIAQNATEIVTAAIGMLTQIIETLTNEESVESLIQSALTIILAIAEGIVTFLPDLIDAAISVIEKIVFELTKEESLDLIIGAAFDIIMAVADGIFKHLPELVDAACEIILRLVEYVTDTENMEDLGSMAGDLVETIGTGLLNSVGELVEGASAIVAKIVETIFSTDWWSVGVDIVRAIGRGFENAWNNFSANHSATANALLSGMSTGETARAQTRINGKHADGLDYVPFDGYIAELHKGEMVVPAAESRLLRSGMLGATSNEIVDVLEQILYAVRDSNTGDISLNINNREFARMVKAVN